MAEQAFDDRDGWILDRRPDRRVARRQGACPDPRAPLRQFGVRRRARIRRPDLQITEHSRRLKELARLLLDFDIRWTVDEIDAAKADVLRRNNLIDAYLPRRVAGFGDDGSSAPASAIHCAIAAWRWPSYFDPGERMRGLRLDMAEYRRPDPATAPSLAKASGGYMIATLSRIVAERRGFSDALARLAGTGGGMHCGECVFVRDDGLHTPVADCFLSGITRATVIDLARGLGFPVIETGSCRRSSATLASAFWRERRPR